MFTQQAEKDVHDSESFEPSGVQLLETAFADICRLYFVDGVSLTPKCVLFGRARSFCSGENGLLYEVGVELKGKPLPGDFHSLYFEACCSGFLPVVNGSACHRNSFLFGRPQLKDFRPHRDCLSLAFDTKEDGAKRAQSSVEPVSV